MRGGGGISRIRLCMRFSAEFKDVYYFYCQSRIESWESELGVHGTILNSIEKSYSYNIIGSESLEEEDPAAE